MGVPTKAIGDGFVKAHEGNEETLLAALVDLQIPVEETNLDYWLKRIVPAEISASLYD